MFSEINPIELFRRLSTIPAVSFFEYLTYDFIVNYFALVAAQTDAETAAKLEMGFTAANQLRIRWTGVPEQDRRLILVSHADKEGFIIEEISSDLKSCYGRHVRGEPLEEARIFQNVRIYTKTDTFRGRINHEDMDSLEIEFLIEERIGGGISQLRTSEHVQAIAEYDLKEFSLSQEGIISSPCVDNFAGVSVIASVLHGMCKDHWPANVDAIFTTCEEPGFCGVVRLILEDDTLINDLNNTWIVVDSSNRSRCYTLDAPGCFRAGGGLSVDRLDQTGIDIRATVNRIGDRYLYYSQSVAELVHLAALNTKRKLFLQSEFFGECDLPDEFTFMRSHDEWYRAEEVDFLTCKMVGGWCEAGPMQLASMIRRRMGLAATTLPKVGSLAIPIGNYRNTFEGRIAREKCHAASVTRACSILAEIGKLNQRYDSRRSPDSNVEAAVGVGDRIEELIGWFSSNKIMLGITDSWIKDFISTTGVNDFGGLVGKEGFAKAKNGLGYLSHQTRIK